MPLRLQLPLTGLLGGISLAAAAPDPEISFNRDVQPILSENCYACHGFDPGARTPKDNPLRLDREEFAFRPRDNGQPVILRGNPAGSALITRIRETDPEKVMPPPDSHKTVSAEDLAVLERWIREGAEYEEHWAFTPPADPSVPESESSGPMWGNTAVDAFILRQLRAAGLKPNPPADPRRLLRRVTLDLTGLLPDPAELEAFAADPSEEAYLAQVDKLLASPAFGEHRARYWLDYARYADTHGKHFDNVRSIWPWRDYVIRSFNSNKPFDRFVREQLAGDLMPDADFDSLVGTGYLRCAVTTNEGGTIPEEIQVDKVRDRVEAFGATFLGLTVGCASCHDHKFDPLTQADFYRLNAFFNNTSDKPWDDNRADPPPVVHLPPEGKQAEADALTRELAALKQQLGTRRAHARELLGTVSAPKSVDDDAQVIRLPFDEGAGDTVHNRAPGSTETFEVTVNPLFWGEDSWLWPGMRMDISSKLRLGDHGDFEANQAFTVASWFRLRLKPSSTHTGSGSLVSRMGDMSRMAHRGWDLFQDNDRFIVHIVHQWPEHAIRVESPPFPRGEWTHVAFSYDGSSKAAGVKLFVDGREVATTVTHDSLQPGQSIRTDAPMHVGRREDTQPMRETAFQDTRLYQRSLSPEEMARLPFEDPAARVIGRQADPAKWNHDEAGIVLRHWFHGEADPEARDLREQIATTRACLDALTRDGPVTLVATERPTAAEAHVLERGVYSARLRRVFPGTPEFLPPLPDGSGRDADRLALADWLLDESHPLFARVTINRIWQELFGVGLVETADDFGIMGSRPSHPELLDWLALELRRSGWDLKRFYRELVRSAAYRQAETISPEKLAADPANRLLSRGPRFRMDAEVLRDVALQSSGLLVPTIGGPPVRPYQPEGLWRAVSMPESNTFTYQQEHGEALYRRSLYCFWKRFAPPPSLETFDAPAREVVCARRSRSNTPLQALVLMNDPQFIEAARKLAERTLKSATDDSARLDFLSRTLLSRPPRDSEATGAPATLAAYREHFSKDPEGAAALLKTGEAPADPSLEPAETAAWTLLASQYFNLDEFLNR